MMKGMGRCYLLSGAQVFIDILCKSSRAQIEAIKTSYEKQFNMSVNKTDEATIVSAISGHDKNELFHIDEFYLETYGSALVEDLKSELSGCLLMAAVTWTNVPDPLDLQVLNLALVNIHSCLQTVLLRSLWVLVGISARK